MGDCANNDRPQHHGGTSQEERRLLALAPESAKVDDSDFPEWIAFAGAFSRHIVYQAPDGSGPRGSFEAFFNRDVAAVLGKVAVQSVEVYRAAVGARLSLLRDDDGANDQARKDALTELFGAVFSLAQGLDNVAHRLPPQHSFVRKLLAQIESQLRPAIHRLLGHLKGAAAKKLLVEPWDDHPLQVLGSPLGHPLALTSGSGLLASAWWSATVTGVDPIAADESIFAGANPAERMRAAANHHLFSGSIDAFTRAYAKLIDEAGTALARSLSEDSGHEPHYALFLSFLQLFRLARDRLNAITGRHLDFYYRDVLRLRSRPALPDNAHVIAELARSRQDAVLAAGTEFVGDKDRDGRTRHYRATEDTPCNRAALVRMMAVCREPSGRMYASEDVASQDGMGEPLIDPEHGFHPFVGSAAPTSSDAQASAQFSAWPAARVGFGVQTGLLFLAGGARTVFLTLDAPLRVQPAALRCLLSGPEGWFVVDVAWIEQAPYISGLGKGAQRKGGRHRGELLEPRRTKRLVMNLSASDPAVVAVDPKLHGDGFAPGLPAMQLLLQNEAGSPFAYDLFRNLKVGTLGLRVETRGVSADQLLLAGPNGALDASKPFMPWGATPMVASSVVIGCDELFRKPGAHIDGLHVTWVAVAPGEVETQAELEFLQNGRWQGVGKRVAPCATLEQTLIADREVPSEALLPALGGAPEGTRFNASARAGFMRLALRGDFGHGAYPGEYLQYSLKLAKWVQDGPGSEPQKELRQQLRTSGGMVVKSVVADSPPRAPVRHTPTALSITLDYHAQAETTLSDTAQEPALRFYHVGPFGIAERRGLTSDGLANHPLLPQFKTADPPGLSTVGEWYLGFSELSARRSVGVLFQLLEGTTEPLLQKPLSHVCWSVWATDRFIPFPAGSVRDGTRQLTRSGILRFAIPEGATTDAGLMPHGLIWVRATVTEAPRAVCRVEGVHAQAVRVAFVDHDNAPDAAGQPLPPDTLKKLLRADAAFRKFSQSYASFGGRPAEHSAAFYQRSSERLRHKDRALTIWDYERLLLGAFPQVHRVCCLPHTHIEDLPGSMLGGGGVHNEHAPGHVTLVIVPQRKAGRQGPVLTPYAPLDLLEEIREFVTARASGQLAHATAPRIHVCQPLFEEVVVGMKLRLRPGYDDFVLYRRVLGEALTQFLSPWAFDLGKPIVFSGRILRSAVINFIEEQPYVDVITDVTLRKRDRNGSLLPDSEVADPGTSRSILVAAPAIAHIIEPHGAS